MLKRNLIIMVALLLISSVITVSVFAAETLGAKVTWDEEKKEVHLIKEDSKIIAQSEDAKTNLYQFKENEGLYEGMILEVEGHKHFFDWLNVTNPTYHPQITYADLNQDGVQELITILTVGTGTGLNIREAHVLNPQTFVEYDLVDPLAFIAENVRTKIAPSGVELIINNQQLYIEHYEEYWFDQVGFGSIVGFELEDGKLVAKVAVQVSPAEFIGELKMTYAFVDKILKPAEIEFIEYKNSYQ